MLKGELVNATTWPLYARRKGPEPTVQEVGWAIVRVWTGAENLAVTEILSPDILGRSESLY